MLSKLKKLFKISKKKTIKNSSKSTKKTSRKKISNVKKSKIKPSKKQAIKRIKLRTSTNEELVGIITHYFPHVKAGVIKIKKGTISLGDSLHIKGHTTDFIQKINSLEIDRKPIQSATKGKEIGILVKSRVRHNDKVYKLK
ncbi:MAG: hypothetical protein PHI86_00120 [Candidatus Omnitrophica bacterium]|nr:hypothetical protein [Candidatus Omnitrophota bacterium]